MSRHPRLDRSIHRLHLLAMIALSLVFPLTAGACLWDYDTLKQERSRFPTALELITGKFPRHSREFYEWRVKDRQQKIAATGATPELLDDLAVAFDKLGDQTQAIATMERAEKLSPGRYETAANLGTFYFHAKQFKAGIPHIERALKINPDAHFGREKYQLLLVQYLVSKQVDGKTKLPLATANASGEVYPVGFREFVLHGVAADLPVREREVSQAVAGILGMMRFGKHDSPILLEVLGDLLYGGEGDRSNNQQLAARAYLRASDLAQGQPEVSATYRKRAEAVLVMQMGGTGQNGRMELRDLEPVFQKELADAEAWFQTLAQNEHQWVTDGADPEARFTAVYFADPDVPELDQKLRTTLARTRWNPQRLAVVTLSLMGLGLAAFILVRRWLIDHHKSLTETINREDLFQ